MNQSEIDALARSKGLSPEELVALARRTFGAIGGKSGKGESKRRDPAHYQRMVEARNRQRAEKKRKLAAGK